MVNKIINVRSASQTMASLAAGGRIDRLAPPELRAAASLLAG